MAANVGGADKLIRLVLGVALLAVAAFHVIPGNLAIVAYVAGGIALVTGLISFCPAWAIFKINTCSTPGARTK